MFSSVDSCMQITIMSFFSKLCFVFESIWWKWHFNHFWNQKFDSSLLEIKFLWASMGLWTFNIHGIFPLHWRFIIVKNVQIIKMFITLRQKMVLIRTVHWQVVFENPKWFFYAKASFLSVVKANFIMILQLVRKWQ